jgi:hypothetical protein
MSDGAADASFLLSVDPNVFDHAEKHLLRPFGRDADTVKVSSMFKNRVVIANRNSCRVIGKIMARSQVNSRIDGGRGLA